jgi:hypothetical protein
LGVGDSRASAQSYALDAASASTEGDGMTKRKILPLRKERGVMAQLSECMDCSWKSDRYGSAGADAESHARKTGHEVRCDQSVSIIFNRRTR